MNAEGKCAVCELDVPAFTIEKVTELGWVGVISTLAYDGVPFLARGLWCCPDCSSIHGLRRLRSMRENCKPPKD